MSVSSATALALAALLAAPTATPPASSPPPPVVMMVQAQSAAPPADAPPPRQPSRAGDAMLITGAVLTGVGAASLLFVAAPAAIVKNVTLNRARRDPLVAGEDRETRYRRARIADDTMEGGFWAGIAGIGIGVPLIIAGAVVRSQAKNRTASRVQMDASGVAVRF